MKNFILSAIVISICWGCNREQQTLQNKDETTSEAVMTGTAYGQIFSKENVLTMTQLQEALQEQDSVQAIVKGKIIASCQSKGCWMDIKMADNSTMKVTFKDYGFLLPVEDMSGKEVVFSGIAKRAITSVDDQRHYAQDAGRLQKEIDAITTPKQELQFVADGVIVK